MISISATMPYRRTRIIVLCVLLTFASCRKNEGNLDISAVKNIEDVQRFGTNKIDEETFSTEESVMNSAILTNNSLSIEKIGIVERVTKAIIHVQQKIIETLFAYSADTVFISDPFYATNFVGSGLRGYEQFYSIAHKKGLDARMFVIVEPTQSTYIGNVIDEQPNSLLFSSLSAVDMWYIRYAKNVVISPLLPYLAPKQYEEIANARRDSNRQLSTLAYDLSIFEKGHITIDYSKAMAELGIFASELALRKNNTKPKIYAILDSNDSQNIVVRLQYFLKTVFQNTPQAEIYYYWGKRTEANEEQTRTELESVPEDAVVLIDAGAHSYSVISRYFDTHKEDSQRIKGRILWVSHYSPEQLQYKIPVSAAVFVPKDIIFQNIDNTSAIFSRIKE